MTGRGSMVGAALLAVVAGASLSACGGGGPASTPGVVGDTIAIGALIPLSDAVAVIGKPIALGLQAYARQVNERGGLAGRYHLRVIEEDITYANPSTGAQKYQKIKPDVAMFASVVGTDQVNGLLPLLGEDSVIAIPTTFDKEWVRQPNLLPWAPTYQVWAINGIAHHVAEQPGNHTVCTLSLATGYGEASVEGVEFLAAESDFTVPVKASFRQDDQDFVAPITQLRNAGCSVVYLTSLPGVTGKVLGAAAQLGYAPRWIAAVPGWHPVLLQSPLRDYLVENLRLVAYGSEWGDTTAAATPDLLAAVTALAPDQPPDLYVATGYILGKTAGRLLETAIAAGDLSRTGLLRALTAMDSVGYGGLAPEYRYGPVESRQPPVGVSIFRIDPAAPWGVRMVVKNYHAPAAVRFRI